SQRRLQRSPGPAGAQRPAASSPSQALTAGSCGPGPGRRPRPGYSSYGRIRGDRARGALTAGGNDAGELGRADRHEAPRVRAALAARLGDVALAEESVQDAFIEALEHWRAGGVPPNPGGWLATTAWRKAVDRIRRDRAGQEKLALLAAATPPSAARHGRP